MNGKIAITIIFLFVLLCTAHSVNGADAKMLQLNQYLSEYQENPNDAALRDEIIRLVRGMPHEPAIPEEAKRFFIRGQERTKEAKSPDDFEKAAEEFTHALQLAPWWSSAYYNRAVLLEKSCKYVRAIESYNLYLSTSPKAPDARKVKEHIYAVEVLAESPLSPEALGQGTWLLTQLLPDGSAWNYFSVVVVSLHFSGNNAELHTILPAHGSPPYDEIQIKGVFSENTFKGTSHYIHRIAGNTYDYYGTCDADIRSDVKHIKFNCLTPQDKTGVWFSLDRPR